MVTLTRLQLFQAMQEVPLQNQTDYLLQFILQKLNVTDCPLKTQHDLKHSIRVFMCYIKNESKSPQRF